MNSNLLSVIKDKTISIPLYMLKLKDKLKIDSDSFIFLMYLHNRGELTSFDVNSMAFDLGVSNVKIMDYIGKLSSNNLIDLKVVTNDKGVMEEFISLENFYNKVGLLIIDEVVGSDNNEKVSKTIFESIEQEFGRTLSPIEVEIIRGWLESNIKTELIERALREATFNGVANLKYIDKILYEWGKKGFKTSNDVDKHLSPKREIKQEKLDVFDYDWLDEE